MIQTPRNARQKLISLSCNRTEISGSGREDSIASATLGSGTWAHGWCSSWSHILGGRRGNGGHPASCLIVWFIGCTHDFHLPKADFSHAVKSICKGNSSICYTVKHCYCPPSYQQAFYDWAQGSDFLILYKVLASNHFRLCRHNDLSIKCSAT